MLIRKNFTSQSTGENPCRLAERVIDNDQLENIKPITAGRKPLVDPDQAEGLRRLLARSTARVVAVVGARSGLGSTSMVVNLASTWARSGKSVLILDEHITHNNVANTLALKPRFDLLNVISGDKTLGEVMLNGSEGIQILPLARAMKAIPMLLDNERDILLQLLTRAASGADVVLVDAAAREGHSVCASLSVDDPLMLVLNATASGITESYAMLKQMSLQNGRQTFDIVVNKVNNEREAETIYNNIAQVAWQKLRVRLQFMGYISVDEKLKRATQLSRSVVETFPGAKSAIEYCELAQSLMNAEGLVDQEMNGLTRIMQRLIRQTRPNNYMASAIT